MIKGTKKLLLGLLLPGMLLFGSCGGDSQKVPDRIAEVETDEVQLEIKIRRFEQDLFALKSVADMDGGLKRLRAGYGDFYVRYVSNIMQLGNPNDPMMAQNIAGFLNDKDINAIYNDVQKTYRDLSPLEEALEGAFKRYKAHFPSKVIPQVVTYISGFGYAVVATDSVLGIGLDRYLGSDYKYYKMMGLPQYMAAKANSFHVPVDAMKGWIGTEFEPDLKKKNMLNDIIHEGKVLYCMDVLFPELDDTLKMGYTAKQLAWANANEFFVWSYLIDKKMLFSSNAAETMKWINEAPFTSGLPKDSPPRLGVWVGWMIVRNYMKNNEVTLDQLMREKDAQKILNKSKYKPKK